MYPKKFFVMAQLVLVVDDEEDVRKSIVGILSDEGYEVLEAASAEEAIATLRHSLPSLILLDVWLHEMDGLAFLSRIRLTHPDIPVLMISGHGTVETAVKAIQKGAFDFIEKPFQAERLLLSMRRAFEKTKLLAENRELKNRIIHLPMIWGSHTLMDSAKKVTHKLMNLGNRVLISGPSGCGKERLAREIHMRSPHTQNGPFITVHCGNLDPYTFEEKLWGVEKVECGIEERGYLEQAHQGTLFLKSVHEMPLTLQSKFLKVLCSNEYRRVGSQNTYTSRFRLVSSVGPKPLELVQSGRLREDFFYRLNVIQIPLPSLHDRRLDVGLFVEAFLAAYAERYGRSPKTRFSIEALTIFENYKWPGNIRELLNMLERIMILSREDAKDTLMIDKGLLPEELYKNEGALSAPKTASNKQILMMSLKDARTSFERDYLKAQVVRFGGNIQKTAHFIGMERSALHRKIRYLNLQTEPKSSTKESF